MSQSGIYPALSGAAAESRNLEVVANNLANAASSSFRGLRVGFKEVLSRAQRVRASAESRFVQLGEYTSDVTPGTMRHTGEGGDVALSGPGFLVVQTRAGQRYTRGGSLRRGPDGTLETSTGAQVLDRAGQPIRLPKDGDLQIGSKGEVAVDDQVRAVLGLVEFQQPQLLRSEGGGLLAPPPGPGFAPAPATATEVVPEYLEGANVSPVRAMTDVITISRHYEALHRVIEIFREIDTQAAQEIATVS